MQGLEGLERLSVRDLLVLKRIASRGRARAGELAGIASTGALYASLNRLMAMGLVRKTSRGEFEATSEGVRALRAVKQLLADGEGVEAGARG